MRDLCADCIRQGAAGCVTVGGKCGPSVQEVIDANLHRRSKLHDEIRRLEVELTELLNQAARRGYGW